MRLCWRCIRSLSLSATASVATTSSTWRGGWVSSPSRPLPPSSAVATRCRRWLLLVLVAIWGLRLSGYIYRRSIGHGEDPRYADLLRDATVGQIVGKVFLLQAFATWFISLPLQLSAVAGPTPRHWLAVTLVGVLVWLTGVMFESVGDHQLRVFKADSSHRGLLMDRGLWAWTRHPNYFGDACVWWGLWLITITGWWSLATVLSPSLDDLFPGLRHRGAAHREVHEGPSGVQRIPATDILFHSTSAPIGTKMTTAVAERIGYRPMTEPRHGNELDSLLRRVARRDTEAFAALYDHTRARVYGLDHPRAARLRLQRGDHPGGLSGGVADRREVRLRQEALRCPG